MDSKKVVLITGAGSSGLAKALLEALDYQVEEVGDHRVMEIHLNNYHDIDLPAARFKQLPTYDHGRKYGKKYRRGLNRGI